MVKHVFEHYSLHSFVGLRCCCFFFYHTFLFFYENACCSLKYVLCVLRAASSQLFSILEIGSFSLFFAQILLYL